MPLVRSLWCVTKIETLNQGFHATLLMTASAALLVVNDSMVKFIGDALPITQIIAIRAVAILMTCAAILGFKRRRLTNPFTRDVLLRTGFTVGNAFAFVATVRALPLSVAVLIDFTNILFVALLAPFVLSEKLTLMRLSAVFVGLMGAFLILSPEVAVVGLAAGLPLLSGALGAGRELWTRKLGQAGPSPEELTLYAAAGMIIIAVASGPQNWSFVLSTDIGLSILAGICQAAALILMAAAFHHGEAGLVAPFRLTSLIWALLLGYLLFGDRLALQQLCGVAAILSGLLLSMFTFEKSKPKKAQFE